MRIGMVGTRFAGLDGVSLEAYKVAEILGRSGHEVAWFAGQLGARFTPGVTVPAAHFADPAELSRQALYFGSVERPPGLAEEIRHAAATLRRELRRFVADHRIDVLMPQNALAIPMQIPLGVAITDVISEGVPALGHHHDFAWERSRFSPSCIGDFLEACFPPRSSNLEHLVISSIAQGELARRRGVTSWILPNVMDFRRGPPEGDPDALRRIAGIGPELRILLQPTRVIPRKSIDTTIDLAARLGDCVVVITHEEGDEGEGYGQALQDHADVLGVDLRFVHADGIDGAPTLADAYAAADLVVYPSRIEGFGNALIEAFFFRRPVLVRRYPVYRTDIAPTGVQALEMDEYLTGEVVAAARRWLEDPDASSAAIAANYRIGERLFSMETAQSVLDQALAALMARRP